MKNAEKRDAARVGKFWFRRDISVPVNVLSHFIQNMPDCDTSKISKKFSKMKKSDTDIYSVCELMSIDEIINGKMDDDGGDENKFPGLIPLLNMYLDSMEINADTRCTINSYLRLISDRAKGVAPTSAQLIRKFVRTHPDYRFDSIINNEITYDLLDCLQQIQTETLSMEQFVANIEQRLK